MKRLLRLSVVCLLLVLGPLVAPATAETEPKGVWPLAPRPEVVHGFDPPAVSWAAGHRGVDLQGSIGQPVRAALAGRVSFAGRIAGVGVVVVDHGATRTTYQPVSATARVGREVAAGATIGTLEWFGTHCLPSTCLHWGLLEGERYLDPLSLVGGPRPVRLLPLDAPAAARRGPARPFLPVLPMLPMLPVALRLWG